VFSPVRRNNRGRAAHFLLFPRAFSNLRAAVSSLPSLLSFHRRPPSLLRHPPSSALQTSWSPWRPNPSRARGWLRALGLWSRRRARCRGTGRSPPFSSPRRLMFMSSGPPSGPYGERRQGERIWDTRRRASFLLLALILLQIGIPFSLIIFLAGYAPFL